MEKDIVIVILNWNGQKMMSEYLKNVEMYSRDEADIVVAEHTSRCKSSSLTRTGGSQRDITKL